MFAVYEHSESTYKWGQLDNHLKAELAGFGGGFEP